MYAFIFFACINTYHLLLTMNNNLQLNEDLANYSTYSNIISFKNDTYGIITYNSFPMSIAIFNQDKSKTMHLSSTELLELMNSFFSKNFKDKDYNDHRITNDLKLFFTKNDKRSSNVKIFLDCFVGNTETNARSFFSFDFYNAFLGTFFQYDNSQDNYIRISDRFAKYEKNGRK